jgi:putative tricarboxylic transport membrane protein
MEYLQEFTKLWTVGLPVFYSWYTIGLILFGTVVGVLFGSLPGLSSSMALAIFTPLTFALGANQAIVLLIALYIAAVFGGAISVVLVNIPGTPSSIATGFDGYPMAKQGKAGAAIGIATWSSVLGGLIGLVALAFFSPLIARVAKSFGTWEYAVLALLGLSIVSYISKGSYFRGLLGASIGLFLASIGQDPIVAYPRFTFGIANLIGGLDVVVVIIGLFGVSEVLFQLEKDLKINVNQKITNTFGSIKDVFSNWKTLIRSSVIGTIVGAIPAAGGAIAAITSYGFAKRFSKKAANFGLGEPEGIVAAESANNACVGGALIPMLTLGIPGDPMTAILIGALMIHGLIPGPMLFVNHIDFVSSIFIGYAISLVFILLVGLLGASTYARLLKMPRHILLPVIMLLCILGSYSLSSSIFDIGVVVVFGIVGYYLQKVGISPAPVVLGFVLGPILETNFRRSLILGQGSLLPFITRPICLIILVIILFMVISAVKQAYKDRKISEIA